MRWILVALCTLACGPRYGASGEYRGPNILDFTVQSPVQRPMPQERNDGSAGVIDEGDYVTFELRIFGGNETPCRLQAQRSYVEEGRVDILPGQQCTSPFRYEGRPVEVHLTIRQGAGYFDHDRLSLAIDGTFAADVYAGGQIVPTQGVASWRFEGWR
jgi:hypothetical protein